MMSIISISDLSADDIMDSILNSKFTPHDNNGSLSKRFIDIKSAWENKLPIMIRQFEKDGDFRADPYFYDWLRIFSHIEGKAWNDIRYLGVPLYPQFPTNGFFLDFANPIIKIALECDGAAFHDKEKDLLRDEKLLNDGWIIIRVTGRECNLSIDEPFYRKSDEDELVRNYTLNNWFMNSSEGVIYSINKIIFTKLEDDFKYYELCIQSINLHLSKAHGYKDIITLIDER